MTRIAYKITGDIAEMRSFDSDGTLIVDIDISPRTDGYVVIGGEVIQLSMGHVMIDMSRFGEGEYTPMLYADRVITMEPIKREKGRIVFSGTPDSTLRALLVRCERAEEEISRLAQRVMEISNRVGREIIF